MAKLAVADIDERWLPPSPHREKLLEVIGKGRAHVEEQGHGKPPLVFFEDGGMMELPRVRHAGGNQFISDQSAETTVRQTRYTDVCGTVDELKRIVAEEPQRVKQEPQHIAALLDDIDHMLRRMQRRREVYEEAGRELLALAQRMLAISGPDVPAGLAKLEELRRFLAEHPEAVSQNVAWLHDMAEQVRKVAGETEQVLYPYRDLWIEIGQLYYKVRGQRAWEERAQSQDQG